LEFWIRQTFFKWTDKTDGLDSCIFVTNQSYFAKNFSFYHRVFLRLVRCFAWTRSISRPPFWGRSDDWGLLLQLHILKKKVNVWNEKKSGSFILINNRLSHGQSSYWTAKLSFLFLASDHTEADPNYTLRVDFWTMIFFKSKKFRLRSIWWAVKLYFEFTRSWWLSCSNIAIF
jgi:hypothetical protein